MTKECAFCINADLSGRIFCYLKAMPVFLDYKCDGFRPRLKSVITKSNQADTSNKGSSKR